MTASYEWIDRSDDLSAVVEELAAQPAYALDTEFHRERTYYPHAALVQLAWRNRVVLVDPLAVDLRALRPVLESGGTVVMHAGGQDLEVLDRECGAVPARIFDTQVAAGFLGFSSPSLASLAQTLLGVDLPKGSRLTDWLQRPLDEQQKAYAAADVVHLLDIHDRLRIQLEEAGRLQWAEEECERVRKRARGPVTSERAWWRIKEARHLRRVGRKVAQAVAAWREETAAAQDRPVRSVLPDLAVVTIAGHPPRDLQQLRNLRGLDARHLRGGAESKILAAVERGLSMSDAELQLPPRDDVDRDLRPVLTLVSAWVSQLGRDLHIDPALLATRSDMVAFLRREPDARLGEGWRADLVGGAVKRLLTGDAALAFAGDGRLVLEARSGRPLGDGGGAVSGV